MASSKLEMSLDDIIKQTKKTERSQKKVGGSTRKSHSKKVSFGVARKNKRIGRQRLNVARKNKQSSNSKPLASLRRKTTSGMNMNNKRRNGVVLKNKTLTTAATAILVKKLVKKALTQTNTLGPARGIRPKFNRSLIGNARILGRSPLNRVNKRSRQIVRRQRIVAPIPMATVQMGTKIRGRGPIRYVPIMETIPAVRRIRYVPQRVANKNFGGMMVHNSRGPKNNGLQQQRFSTVREQINALRQGATRTQNRQQVVMQMQQQSRVRMVPTQQNRRRQSRQQQQFLGQRKQTQQVLVDPFYDPPNYLQRIPTQQIIANGNKRIARNF